MARLAEARAIIDDVTADADLRALALEEAGTAEADASSSLARLEAALRHSDEDEGRDALVEITAGVGGDEAALFVETLLGMYLRYARGKSWTVEIDETAPGTKGGLKAVRFCVKGAGAYGRLGLESGLHRVQRFSETAAKDVMHTSAASVVVLPLVEDARTVIAEKDVRMDTFASGGPGGQHQNKTQSGVRLTHEPTGISVEFRARSQNQNHENCWRVLAARVEEHFRSQRDQERGETRRRLRGTGSRSEKARTYNFPQDRVTDHRVPVTIHGLARILAGRLDPLLDAVESRSS